MQENSLESDLLGAGAHSSAFRLWAWHACVRASHLQTGACTRSVVLGLAASMCS